MACHLLPHGNANECIAERAWVLDFGDSPSHAITRLRRIGMACAARLKRQVIYSCPTSLMGRPGKTDRTALLLRALNIDPNSFGGFLEWVLCEHLVIVLSRLNEINAGFFSQPNALRQFRDLLRMQTGRSWSEHDLEALFRRVKLTTEQHFRSEVSYEERLKLLWQIPWECARCHKKPPDVVLHVDHIIPASVGGRSSRQNLQFLCAEHNLTKSNKREFENQWLNLK
jgi:5-methylcytosine-specific restriction endonuclease McrA